MVDQLSNQYRSRPAVFLEHDVDNPVGNRRGRWWAACSTGRSAQTPMVMVDSGQGCTQGHHDNFATTYRRMVEDAMDVPAKMAVEAYYEELDEGGLRVFGTLTNIDEDVHGYDDYLTLNVIVYEERKVIHTNRFVRQAVEFPLQDDIEPGASQHFDVTVDELNRANMARSEVLVLIDHRPDPSERVFVSLQAGLASSDVPTPTPAVTDTPAPTATPEPTDVPPTAPPAPTATDVPPEETGGMIYLPVAKKG